MFNSNNHNIRRILVKNNIEIISRKTKKPFTEERKMKVSLATKGRTCWSKELRQYISERYPVDIQNAISICFWIFIINVIFVNFTQ